jgi:ABC-type multidrug transport system fused ATPase/permease subunit
VAQGITKRGVLRGLYAVLPAGRRRQTWWTVALMLVGAVAEVLSIGSILPFLAVLLAPEKLATLPVVGALVASLPPGTNLVNVATLTFVLLTVLSGAVRLLLTRAGQGLAFGMSYDLSLLAYRKLLRQPYRFYLENNSAVIVSNFEKIHQLTYGVLLGGLQAAIALILSFALTAFLVVVSPTVAVVAGLVFIGTYVLTSMLVRGTLARNSSMIATGWVSKVRIVQESMGAIRDILIDRSQHVFESAFRANAGSLRRALTSNGYIAAAPRVVIEMVALLMIGIYAWYLARTPNGLAAAIPVLGAFALGGQRLLPQLQAAFSGWSQLRGGWNMLQEVTAMVTLPEVPVVVSPEVLPLRQQLAFRQVEFGYSADAPVLRDINLVIARGERIGLAGTTGSGKSTLMDLLLGLLEPTAGTIEIDGHALTGNRLASWQAQIAHVPQSIFLIDDSIAANIALGVPRDDIDQERVAAAARSAGIDAFINSLPERYDTRCGERGARLSGGQRQRIGIARALYKRASVLVFDEATSALDNATEREVMASVAGLNRDITIFMIAHRLSTLDNCDRVLRLEGGRIVGIDAPSGRAAEQRVDAT